MKKRLLVLAMTLMLLVSITTPVSASNRPPGSPGWSHVNPGSGGTLPPAKGK